MERITMSAVSTYTRYLAEFDFRYNTRKITDGERSCLLIGKVGGKRLKYKELMPKREA
jgi:hypothetical protein